MALNDRCGTTAQYLQNRDRTRLSFRSCW